MNKNILVGILITSIAIIGYFGFVQKENVVRPESLPEQVPTNSSVKQEPTPENKISTNATASTTRADWKTYSENGISIAAPTGFVVKSNSSATAGVVFIISSPKLIGSIEVTKFPNKTGYEAMFAQETITRNISEGNLLLIHTDYTVGGTTGKVYNMNFGNGTDIGTTIILIPNKFVAITVTPDEKSWVGYSETDVNTMIKSITF